VRRGGLASSAANCRNLGPKWEFDFGVDFGLTPRTATTAGITRGSTTTSGRISESAETEKKGGR